jgi:serine/threonine protein kinase
MLLRSGEVKLLDFGVARAAAHVRSTLTRHGVIKGKAAYMAPEQVRGKQLDHRADIFALGIVLWESMTGRPLFRSSSMQEAAAQVLDARILPPTAVRDGVPPELERIVMNALGRDPSARYQHAGDMAADLAVFLQGRRDPASSLRLLVDALMDRARNRRTRSPDALPVLPKPTPLPMPSVPTVRRPPLPPPRWARSALLAGAAALLMVLALGAIAAWQGPAAATSLTASDGVIRLGPRNPRPHIVPLAPPAPERHRAPPRPVARGRHHGR